MSAKETTLNELGEMLGHVVEHMATKDDIKNMTTKADVAALSDQVTSIERELRSIRRDLDQLTDKVDNIAGYRKEIDHAFERIATIERHLGISKQTAA
jgi:predicted  nucleic acid-binding Zn-ribbon protein